MVVSPNPDWKEVGKVPLVAVSMPGDPAVAPVALEALHHDLVTAVAGVPGMDITPEMVKTKFATHQDFNATPVVVVEVPDLYRTNRDKSVRTEKARRLLSVAKVERNTGTETYS
jgi:hypothetical protein